MLITLHKRHFGKHDPIRSITIIPPRNIDLEDCLIKVLPKEFFPVAVNKILLVLNGTAVSKPRHFRKWAKYFDAYSIFVESDN